jgi:hypothetical protein
MFEDETVDIPCPKCGRKNSILVREFEETAETHFVCVGCQAGVRIEAKEFHDRLARVREELEDLERAAARATRTKGKRPRKGDFQI